MKQLFGILYINLKRRNIPRKFILKDVSTELYNPNFVQLQILTLNEHNLSKAKLTQPHAFVHCMLFLGLIHTRHFCAQYFDKKDIPIKR